MKATIIGIDCATKAKKIGLARGFYQLGKTDICEVMIDPDCESIINRIVSWIALAPFTLIAIDAPLGWPDALCNELSKHTAGQFISEQPDWLFRRETDRIIRKEINKKPLEIGADRIARTAHAALSILEEIHQRTGSDIPLAWEPLKEPGIYAIEVYPAATIKSYGIDVSGYKKLANRVARKQMTESLRNIIGLSAETSLMVDNDNALDAAICILAGADFLNRKVIIPTNMQLALKEGWIWARKPSG
jgi:predicted RNase H-like nuclease